MKNKGKKLNIFKNLEWKVSRENMKIYIYISEKSRPK